MSGLRPLAISLLALLLSACATPHQHQLGSALTTLEGELQRLEEQLASLNALHYQKAIDAPLSLRRHLAELESQGVRIRLSDGPELTYEYRLDTPPAGGRLSAAPCHDYEFELRRLGRLGTLHLEWQGGEQRGAQSQRQSDCRWPADSDYAAHQDATDEQGGEPAPAAEQGHPPVGG